MSDIGADRGNGIDLGSDVRGREGNVMKRYCKNCKYFRTGVLSNDRKAICSNYCSYNFRISSNNKNNDCKYYEQKWINKIKQLDIIISIISVIAFLVLFGICFSVSTKI